MRLGSPAPLTPLLALALTVGACTWIYGGSGSPEEGGQVRTPVWTRPIPELAATESGFQAPLREAIRDPQRWIQVWNRAKGNDSTPPPEIDWSREMVLFVASGTQPTAGHAIRIAGVARADSALSATVVETTPAEGCTVAQVVTSPTHAVVVPVTDLPVHFEERRQERACR